MMEEVAEARPVKGPSMEPPERAGPESSTSCDRVGTCTAWMRQLLQAYTHAASPQGQMTMRHVVVTVCCTYCPLSGSHLSLKDNKANDTSILQAPNGIETLGDLRVPT